MYEAVGATSGRERSLPRLCSYRATAQHQQESPQGEQEANRSHGDQPEPLAEKQQLECLEGAWKMKLTLYYEEKLHCHVLALYEDCVSGWDQIVE
ncbi:UNVERIFIED_CONTAM: hypothetical protein K2H54_056565 [Gekko kuhli]